MTSHCTCWTLSYKHIIISGGKRRGWEENEWKDTDIQDMVPAKGYFCRGRCIGRIMRWQRWLQRKELLKHSSMKGKKNGREPEHGGRAEICIQDRKTVDKGKAGWSWNERFEGWDWKHCCKANADQEDIAGVKLYGMEI